MNHSLLIGLAGTWCLLACAPTLPSQQQTNSADNAKSATVEVHYVNGSVVFMTLLDQNIEIMTAFGKLAVPKDQILSIEFGQHLEKETETKIQNLIQQLGDPNYQKREIAFKGLIQLGHQAYPALLENQKHKDLEIAQRVKDALKVIEQEVPAKLLQRKKDDVIYTSPFTIVGKITTPTLRAHAEYFGELILKPSQLVALGSPKQAGGSGQLAIDSAKYGSAHNQWLATGIQVRSGQVLTITASGTIDLVPPQAGQYMSGPYGWQNAGKVQMNVEGTLQGKIGPNGPVFTVGEKFQGPTDRDGELCLHIVPCIWGNASTGSFQVKITLDQK